MASSQKSRFHAKRRSSALAATAAGILILVSCGSPLPIPYAPPTPAISHVPTILEIPMDVRASKDRLGDRRPNVIVFVTDDQPYHTVDYMPAVKNILIAKGITFKNAFATTPLCCPARVSILTGQYVHNHGVYTDRWPAGGARKFDPTSSLAVALSDAGYRTGYFGKYLNGYEDLDPRGTVPPGWSDWGAFLSNKLAPVDDDAGNMQYFYDFTLSQDGAEIPYPRSKANFSADVITNAALSFIRDACNEPFFLMLNYYNPHSPYIAAPRHKDAFRASTDWDWLPYRPPSFNEEDVRDKPRYVRNLDRLSPEELDTAHLQILRSLLSVDDGVASVLAALENTGLDRNTVVIFLSDNGLTLGDHGLGVTKNCPYDACVKVPFIVYAPAWFAPREDNNLVANIDIFPTVMELAQASTSTHVDGVSLVPLLRDAESAWRDRILLEHWPTEEGVGSSIPEFSAIRTAQWKYTEYSTREAELYDLVTDPHELQNLIGRRDLESLIFELVEQLGSLRAR